MLGTTLADIRAHIESLATETGEYQLRCARSGERPVPCTGLRFESRADARDAARATEQYRRALRRYDPQLPYHDIIVSQTAEAVAGAVSPREAPPPAFDANRPPERAPVPGGERGALVEFCHRVAGAVFEALSDGGFDEVESAVMDTYLELAETVPSRDALCLRLLESIAAEFAEQLPPDDQIRVLSGAASLLPSRPVPDRDRAVDAALETLRELGLVGSYSRDPRGPPPDHTAPQGHTDPPEDTATATVRVSGYALSASEGRLPVLPIVLELYRTECGHPSLGEVTALDGGWEIEIGLAERPNRRGLASVAVGPGGSRER